ncbi:MAG TPA: GDSL-type esterase/lipase family protein, partial [Rhodocyclaceae bacterium]|nr:GDSL-type esterase/lipase family protein [Rhodocyclaceae bacterium]
MLRRTFLMAAAGGALLTACGRSAKLPPIPTGSIVLAFGDSVTYGTGASPGEDWPTLLGGMTGWRMVNGGVPGDTAEAGKARIGPLLAEHRPALVIVEIGGNDFLRHRPQKAVKEDIRQILSTVRASGAAAVFVAVPELSVMGAVTRRLSDADLYAELGKEEKVPVISDVFAGILGQPELCSDQIHPNARGYRQMAEGIDAALRKIGLHA